MHNSEGMANKTIAKVRELSKIEWDELEEEWHDYLNEFRDCTEETMLKVFLKIASMAVHAAGTVTSDYTEG